MHIERRGAAFGGKAFDQRLGRLVLDIEEGHARALAGEMRHDGLADAGGPAGH